MLFFYVLPNFCKHCFGSPLVLAAAQNLMAFHVGGGGGGWWNLWGGVHYEITRAIKFNWLAEGVGCEPKSCRRIDVIQCSQDHRIYFRILNVYSKRSILSLKFAHF